MQYALACESIIEASVLFYVGTEWIKLQALHSCRVELKNPGETLPIKVALLSPAVYSCRVELKDPDETLPIKVALLSPDVYPRLLELCRFRAKRCSHRLRAPSR